MSDKKSTLTTPKKPISPNAANPLKRSLVSLMFAIHRKSILVKDILEVDEIVDLDRMDAMMKGADDIPSLVHTLNQIIKDKTTLDTAFYNDLLQKLNDLNQWTLAKRLCNFMNGHNLADTHTFNIMFDIAASHKPTSYVMQMYVSACVTGTANIIIHSRMLNLASELKERDLAWLVFNYSFNTPDAVRNNFGNTTLSHNGHERMMQIAREIDDLDLARLVYDNAGDHQKQNERLHAAMIDFLVARGHYEAALQIHKKQKNHLQMRENKNGMTEVDVSDSNYGTAYLSLMELLQNSKHKAVFVITSSKNDIMKKVLLDIENLYRKDASHLKVDYSNPRFFTVRYQPFQLSPKAEPFTPGKSASRSIFKAEDLKDKPEVVNHSNSRRKLT